MGAPTKEGLDYFPFAVDLLDNDDLDDLRVEYGMIANDIYISLLTLLYRKKGYYIPYATEQERAECHRYIYKRIRGGRHQVKQEVIPMVIAELAEKGLIERYHMSKIITSERAQRTYYSATVERSPGSLNIIPEYWLLNEDTMRRLSKSHPYFISIQSKSKSTEKLNNSTEKLNNSTDLFVKKSKVNNPPIIPPTRGNGEGGFEGIGEDKKKFFSTYPKIQQGRTDDSGIDYKALLSAFNSSAYLRSRYSFKWIVTNYEAIVGGAFDDAEASEGERAARETFYSERRAAAESRADKALSEAMKDSAFAAAYKESKRLSSRAAFADGEEGQRLTNQLCAAERTYRARLKALDLDIVPHYTCHKCNDTGFLKNGKPCDCYKQKAGSEID